MVETDIVRAAACAGLPCYKGEYTGSAEAYLTYNYSTIPTAFADDAPEYERVLVQLHLHCPITQNTAALREDIKQAIFGVGFSYPATEDASDKNGQHIVFEFEDVVPICAND